MVLEGATSCWLFAAQSPAEDFRQLLQEMKQGFCVRVLGLEGFPVFQRYGFRVLEGLRFSGSCFGFVGGCI